jgi:hypothetical protein
VLEESRIVAPSDALLPVTEHWGEAPSSGASPPARSAALERPAAAGTRREESRGEPRVRIRKAPGTAEAGGPVSALVNYEAMVSYAYQYWNNYNGAFRPYDNDCTNFISQAMQAGGWTYVGSGMSDRTDNHFWYYGDFTFTSGTWAGPTSCSWTLPRPTTTSTTA